MTRAHEENIANQSQVLFQFAKTLYTKWVEVSLHEELFNYTLLDEANHGKLFGKLKKTFFADFSLRLIWILGTIFVLKEEFEGLRIMIAINRGTVSIFEVLLIKVEYVCKFGHLLRAYNV